MSSDLDLLGLESVIGAVLLIGTLGGLLLTVLGVVFAIRSWMAQTAALQTRKDVAEIKRQLETITRPAPATPRRPVETDMISDGPKIADNQKP